MKSVTNSELKRFLLLYASQTGQAKAIAEEITELAPSFQLKADLHCLSRIDKRFSIEEESCAVFIVSTTGDGEPPDTAEKFYRRICRHTVKNTFLKNLNFALLALGDSNYVKFCLFGRQLEQRLKALSAKTFCPTGYGDDAVGIETGVDPWLQNLWPALHKLLGIRIDSVNENDRKLMMSDLNPTMSLFPTDILNGHTIHNLSSVLSQIEIDKLRIPKFPSPSLIIKFLDSESEKIKFIPNENFLNSQASPLSTVRLLVAKKLTSGVNVKNTLELTFKFEDTKIDYLPGDSFGFINQNPENEVQKLLQRLGIQEFENSPVDFQIPETCQRKLPSHLYPHLSLKDLFLHCVEIRSVPKKILLRVLAEFASDGDEKKQLLFLCSQEGFTAYTNCIRKPALSLLDILLHFPSCKPPVERVLEYLPNLKTRFYSVTSSPLEDDMYFKIAFNVIQIDKAEGRAFERKGVCSGWFSQLAARLQETSDCDVSLLEEKLLQLSLKTNEELLIAYKRKNLHFLLPDDSRTPIIMIGPGTGIAPFMSFLKHREMQMKSDSIRVVFGETWLFYGCRYKENDFLYENELKSLTSSSVLNHLVLSLSRETTLPPEVTTRYVHESIRLHKDTLGALVHSGARIYVCGDAKHMAQDIQRAFIDVFRDTHGLSEEESKLYVMKLQEQHQYLNDVWA